MTAYKEAGGLNPDQLQQQGRFYFIEPEQGQKLWLSSSMEGRRFALRCRCNQQHVRYCTFNSVRQQDDLCCQYCEHDSDWWRAANKGLVPQCEKDAMQALIQTSLDSTTACQVQLPFWHGRVDFYHIPSKTVIQIDGSSHFYGMHHRTKSQQLMMDIECCKSAWVSGVRLLRVHHRHGDMAQAIATVVELPDASFVMLTVEYEDVHLWCDGEQHNCVEWIANSLSGTASKVHTTANCILFKQLTL